MNTLESIEKEIVTLQQEKALADYSDMISSTGSEPSIEDFERFYWAWCVESGRFYDYN